MQDIRMELADAAGVCCTGDFFPAGSKPTASQT